MPDRDYRAIYVGRIDGGLEPAEAAESLVPGSGGGRLTGLLLTCDGWFVHAVEGARARVSDLLLRLGADGRPREIEVVAFQPIEQRLFPDWSPACLRQGPEVAALVGAVADGGSFDPRRLEPMVLLMLLSEAARGLRAAALEPA